ncbi:MAG: hypothetical protein JXA67_12960 [Micromonosporaceae bacterium]|nr:hypothetical protein [Micromonosporaceae bacterium]
MAVPLFLGAFFQVMSTIGVIPCVMPGRGLRDPARRLDLRSGAATLRRVKIAEARNEDLAAAMPGFRRTFDRLFDRGRSAVLSGSHYRDSPPVEGGRWGLSVVLRPDQDTAAGLAALTGQALAVAGQEHWPTGHPDSVHFTVRAIEVHRVGLTASDPLSRRCGEALERAAKTCGPISLRLGGLTLTPSGVMLCAYPIDSAAGEFAARLGEELGADAWFEQDFDRTIWYATLVHFTGPIADPAGVVDWVAARRDLPAGTIMVNTVALVRFRYDGRQPVCQTFAMVRFEAGAVGASRVGQPVV